jgi:hypothetical protein
MLKQITRQNFINTKNKDQTLDEIVKEVFEIDHKNKKNIHFTKLCYVYKNEITFKSLNLGFEDNFEKVKKLFSTKDINIKSVNFFSCAIDNNILEELIPIFKNISLERLSMNLNFIDDKSSKALVDLVVAIPTLEIFDLGQNHFSDEGVKEIISYIAAHDAPLSIKNIDFGMQHDACYKELYIEELNNVYAQIFMKNNALTFSFGNGKMLDKESISFEVTPYAGEVGGVENITAFLNEPLTQAGEVVDHSTLV